MPTTRTRYQITETDPIARALDLATERWPTEPRSRLVVKLIETGAQTLAAEAADRRSEHARLVEAHAGRFSDVYPADYLKQLRQDWPE
ncbi:MAG: hypothetical protein LBO20_03310 [Bifidobacteriaceae bacterium]|jgi:hypothetical protein|nr:hypothetical protein [Bifidobacteriaceae bacterium]